MKKRKYSVLDNTKYVLRILVATKKKIFVLSILKIVFKVMIPILSSYIIAKMIWLISEGETVTKIIVFLMLAFGIYSIVNAIYTYLEERGYMHFYEVLFEIYMPKQIGKYLGLTLQQQENTITRELYKKAEMAIDGEDTGVEGIYQHIISLLMGIGGLIVYSLLMGSLSVWIVIMIIACSLGGSLISHKATRYYEKNKGIISREELTMKYISRISGDVVSGKDIRIFQLSDWLVDKYRYSIKKVQNILHHFTYMCLRGDLIEEVVNVTRDLIVYLYLISEMVQGKTTISEFVFIIGLINGFSKWIGMIAQNYVLICRDSLMITDYRTFLEINSTQWIPEDTKLKRELTLSDIEVRDACYKYDNMEESIINCLNLKVNKGEHIALVGVNGAGKSTLAKLISGLYIPDSGDVYVNGINTKEQSNYEHLGALFQDSLILSYSIAENIALNEKFREDRIIQVLKEVGLYEKVISLNNGIYSYIGRDINDEGIELSGGEQQKLLLARILYRDASIILLDEPTASMDALAEENIYNLYQEKLKEKTVIFISHRLASTKFCDRIVLIDNGKIVEEGSHEMLIELDGQYSNMFNIQRKYYI